MEVIGSLVVRLWKRIKNGWADWTLEFVVAYGIKGLVG